MSKDRFKENKHREGDLMTHYIDAHKRGDEKKKGEVMQLFQRNIEQRKR